MKRGFANVFWVGLVIAIFVLAIFFILFGNEIWLKIANVTPDFKPIQENSTEIILLRYNIAQDKVQYSDDGARWYNFPDENSVISIGTSQAKAKADFSEYFYNNEKRDEKPSQLDNRVNTLRNPLWIYNRYEPFSILSFEKVDRGNVLIGIKYADQGQTATSSEYLLLTLGDELFIADMPSIPPWITFDEVLKTYEKKTADKLTLIAAPEQEIIEKVSAWRDSIIKKPMQLHYIENKREKCIRLKVERIDNAPDYFLFADLSNQVGTC